MNSLLVCSYGQQPEGWEHSVAEVCHVETPAASGDVVCITSVPYQLLPQLIAGGLRGITPPPPVAGGLRGPSPTLLLVI